MGIETLNTKPRFLKDKRAINLSKFTFDFPALIKNMKHSHLWKKGELISTILLNRPEKQVLLTAMHEKTEINSFQSKGSITFQTIEGELVFHTLEESVIIKKGQQFTLREKIEYSLTNMEETVFLITISDGSLNITENKIHKRL
jgi:DNA-binding HxlR family transcriptional regulator